MSKTLLWWCLTCNEERVPVDPDYNDAVCGKCGRDLFPITARDLASYFNGREWNDLPGGIQQ